MLSFSLLSKEEKEQCYALERFEKPGIWAVVVVLPGQTLVGYIQCYCLRKVRNVWSLVLLNNECYCFIIYAGSSLYTYICMFSPWCVCCNCLKCVYFSPVNSGSLLSGIILYY